jgi:hypothetical protein
MKQFLQSLQLTFSVVLVACLAGCLVPRKHSGLAIVAQPLTRTALLPVELRSSCARTNMSPAKVLRTGNEVLDTLAKRKEGRLIGPSDVASLLGSNGVPACLRWETAPQNIAVESNACAEARQLADRLGVRQVVRCRLNPPITSATWDGSGDGVARESTVHVTADMELINLDTLKVVQTSTGWGKAEQFMGCLLFMVPVYCGTTFGRAVDHAERTALTQLFEPKHPDSKKR